MVRDEAEKEIKADHLEALLVNERSLDFIPHVVETHQRVLIRGATSDFHF